MPDFLSGLISKKFSFRLTEKSVAKLAVDIVFWITDAKPASVTTVTPTGRIAQSI